MSQPKELPEAVGRFAQEHPELWEAYNPLGKAAAQAGPLDEKSQRLVKLALAIGMSAARLKKEFHRKNWSTLPSWRFPHLDGRQDLPRSRGLMTNCLRAVQRNRRQINSGSHLTALSFH
jgi:hypothetical protein